MKENILIVEDEKIVSLDLQNRLSNLKYNVSGIADTAEEAVRMAGELKPDLILMDIMLKGNTDGVTAAETIKIRHDIPIIFVTAFSDEKTLNRAKLTEPFGYIVKPFDTRDLRNAIEIALYKSNAERKIRENERLMNMTLNSVSEAIISVDKDGKITFMNHCAEILTEYSVEEAKGKELETVFRVSDDIADIYLICELYKKEKPDLARYLKNKYLIAKSGKRILIEENRSVIEDLNNQAAGSVIVFKDITERKNIESSIIRSRNYYLTLLDEFPVMIWRSDTTGRINYLNKLWQKFSGRGLEQDLDFEWFNNIHPEDKTEVLELIRQQFYQKEKIECVFRMPDSTGEFKWLLFIGAPYYDLDGEFSGYLGICQDITARILMEKRLAAAKKEAEAASKAISGFLANMSHEVRTPMNGIIGLTEILFETELTKDQSELLSIIRDSAYSLLHFLNNILDYSRLEAGKVKFELREFDLENLIGEVSNRYRLQARNKQLEFSLSIDGSLPGTLVGDNIRIRQVLENILSNAVKFTEKGRIEFRVDLASVSQGSCLVCFSVSDTGIGIRKEDQHLIFRSFTQIDNSTTKRYGGTGLGLSIAKEIADAMKGEISFESKYGTGSTFYYRQTLGLKSIGSLKNNILMGNNV